MEITLILFAVLAVTMLIAAYMVVAAEKVMHAAVWLGGTFTAMAGIFLLLNADFLAAAQVLVYVGAITTLIIFGIMLSDIRDIKGEAAGQGFLRRLVRRLSSVRRGVLPLLAALGFALTMVLAIYRPAPWPGTAPEPVTEVTRAIGEAMFTRYVVPFEVASLVLLVALIGAVVLGRREGGDVHDR